jgi:hypothetical protein
MLQLPVSYNRKTKDFLLIGHFCNWSCMKAYVIDTYNDIAASNINSNILMVRKLMYNTMTLIHKAPSRFRLKMFGGDISIEEFRTTCSKDIGTPREIKQNRTIPGRVKVIPMKGKMAEKLHEINISTTTNEPLRLKRAKPLKREQNNIEGLLGIKRATKA